MKQMIRRILATVLLVSVVPSGFAEFRMWTDQAGKQIEAERVRIVDDKVVLREQDGVTGRLKCTPYGRFKVYHLRGFIRRLFSPDCQPVFPVGFLFCCVVGSCAL